MSTTLNEAAYNVLNLMRGGRSTNNEYISLEQIKYSIRYYRSLLIRRDVQGNRRTKEFEQELRPVKMEAITLSDDNFPGNLPLPTGLTNVLRSSETLPERVRTKDRDGVTFVGGDKAVGSFQLIDYQASPWQQYNKYTSAFRRAWLREDYLYVMGWSISPLPSVNITVRGIFEKPETAYDWRRLSQASVATVAGASGTLSITINGTAYTEAFTVSADATAIAWVATHGATLTALGITPTSSATDEITLTGTVAIGNFSVYDTSTTMTATIVSTDTLTPAFDADATPYPIPLDLLQQITQSLVNGELRLLAGSQNDEVLDSLPEGQ